MQQNKTNTTMYISHGMDFRCYKPIYVRVHQSGQMKEANTRIISDSVYLCRNMIYRAVLHLMYNILAVECFLNLNSLRTPWTGLTRITQKVISWRIQYNELCCPKYWLIHIQIRVTISLRNLFMQQLWWFKRLWPVQEGFVVTIHESACVRTMCHWMLRFYAQRSNNYRVRQPNDFD